MRYNSCFWLGVVFIIACSGDINQAQIGGSVYRLAIVLPKEGDSVRLGDNFSVIVEAFGFESVFVVGENMGISEAIMKPPYKFSLRAPGDRAGKRKITAFGLKPDKEVVSSASVVVNCEPSIAKIPGSITFVSLKSDISQVSFNYPGEKCNMTIMATMIDGRVTHVSNSNMIQRISEDPQVATVGPDSSITAVYGGTTRIVYSGGGATLSVPVKVRGSVKGDLDSNGRVDRHDLNVLLSSFGKATGVMDVRDLNRDGYIDALDAVLFLPLCASHGCNIPADLQTQIVPNIISASLEEAKVKIAQSGFTLGSVTYGSVSRKYGSDHIVIQHPLPNTIGKFGDPIDLTLSRKGFLKR